MEPTKYIKSNRLIVDDNRAYLFFKRFIDMFGALVGLVLLSPLFLVVSILIKVEDPRGGIFFKQVRVGKNGKEFNIYKFRSMVSNAEQLLEGLLDKNETTGAMFKMKDDPRITHIGHFIRKTSIDELPQLLNVLKGDMSLVGPRPPLPREVDEYSDYDMQRLLVTPGCTGLWQISGRSNVGFNQMVEYDLEYIRNRTLLKDIMIMLKTVVQLIWSRGAY
ncbi:sugar transferase [Sporolactobacillus nakayamae]|nr:sugar transferase [Sporolactobacillus nakayamae]